MNAKNSLLVIIILLFLQTFLNAKVRGEFIATKECSAYTSIKKKSNPENIEIIQDKAYSIIGLNVTPHTTWYKINVPSASMKQRWVYFECGKANLSHTTQKPTQNNCHTAGLADGYVFAVSWQPAFCINKSKSECSITDPTVYQATNFTLHGLWPNKKSCAKKYGFCGKYKKAVKGFCNFEPLDLNHTTRTNLAKVMPSVGADTCLQRHEWYKHGTCQKRYTQNEYFAVATSLIDDFNQGEIHKFMSKNIGKDVNKITFFELIDSKFGKNAYKRFKFICQKGNLVDLYINMPEVIPQNASLKDLLQKADEAFSNSCGDSFKIVPIGTKIDN
jgi:ribonuclease T2